MRSLKSNSRLKFSTCSLLDQSEGASTLRPVESACFSPVKAEEARQPFSVLSSNRATVKDLHTKPKGKLKSRTKGRPVKMLNRMSMRESSNASYRCSSIKASAKQSRNVSRRGSVTRLNSTQKLTSGKKSRNKEKCV
jgi:hypothetical protein